jgi:hypothetical protein
MEVSSTANPYYSTFIGDLRWYLPDNVRHGLYPLMSLLGASPKQKRRRDGSLLC